MIRRKLISLTGYTGFTEQLRSGEVLVLELISFRSTRLLWLTDENLFQYVNTVEPSTIVGFFAIREEFRTEVVADANDFPIKTRVHRPVEDVVFSAIEKGVSAVHLYMGLLIRQDRSLGVFR